MASPPQPPAPDRGTEAPPDATLDITADTCPMTFVRTRIALDRLPGGGTLLVRLRGEEPRCHIPAASRELGHAVLSTADDGAGVTTLLIRKKPE